MKISIYLLTLFAFNASAQNCESVIALSKTTTSVVQDQESIDQLATNFCSEYRQSRSSGKNMDAGGSYGLFSATVGMSSQSSDAVASKYCSSANNYAYNKTAYRGYVENISDKAYAAYSSCLALSRSDVKFAVDTAAILASEFSISAGFVSTSGKQKTTIDISASSGIECESRGQGVKVIEIANGTSVSVTCRRSNPTKSGYVKFLNTGIGVNEQMTLPWEAPDTTVVNSQSGVIAMKAVGTRPLTDTAQCPTDSTASRGELGGRVTFTKPFKNTPRISIGISQIDSGIPSNTGMRLSVGVVNADRNGFSYNFNTWCNTTISGATASWIAVSE